MIKFNKHHVTNGSIKARVSYNLDNRIDNRKCVTLYAKDYNSGLGKIFSTDYKNESDIQSDYFDKGKVNLFEGHPLYQVARERVESFKKAS